MLVNDKLNHDKAKILANAPLVEMNKDDSEHIICKKIPTICPYCAVGCGFLATIKDGKLINIEGDPNNPFNKGASCSKGMALRQLTSTNPYRLNSVLYRAPGSSGWEEKSWEWAIERIAKKIKKTRDDYFVSEDSLGRTVNRAPSIAHVGGSPLNAEEAFLLSKLSRAIGLVYMDFVVRL